MKNFLIFLVKQIFSYLKEKGVDVNNTFKLDKEKSLYGKKIEIMEDNFNMLQNEISLKRASIIDAQKSLIENVEPMLMSALGKEDVDFWKKTTITKIWIDKIQDINDLVDEHEDLMGEFQATYYELENLKRKENEEKRIN